MLSEEELVSLMLYGDSQEMMEGLEILHGKFPLEGRYGLLLKCYAGCGEDNVINKSNMYTVSEPRWKMNKEVLDLASTNPREVMYVANRLYQARGACFNPYKDLLRRQMRSGCVGSTNLVGWLQ
jgi:hypothetical protein